MPYWVTLEKVMIISKNDSTLHFKCEITLEGEQWIYINNGWVDLHYWLTECKFKTSTPGNYYTSSIFLYRKLMKVLSLCGKWSPYIHNYVYETVYNNHKALTTLQFRGISKYPFSRDDSKKLTLEQYDEVERLRKVDFGICGWQQGTGKMMIGIKLAEVIAQPSIIVYPSGISGKWYEELLEWLKLDKSSVLHCTNKSLKKMESIDMQKYNIYAVSVTQLENLHNKGTNWNYNGYHVVVDEVDGFRRDYKFKKDDEGKLTGISNMKAYIMSKLSSRMSQLHWMSGTLINNSTTEIVPLLKNHGLSNLIYPLSDFRTEILGQTLEENWFGTSWSKASTEKLYLDRFNEFLKEGLNYRRLLRDDIMEIPAKVRDVINVTELRYTKAEREILEDTDYSNTNFFKLRHQKALTKVKNKDFKETFISLLDKSIVFYRHKDVLEQLVKYVDGTGKKYCKLSDSPTANVNKFQDGVYDVIFVQVEGVMGYTLTAATNEIFVELPDTPGEMLQAEDRLFRHGLDHKGIVYYLLDKNGADSRTLEWLLEKCDYLTALENDREELSLKTDLKEE